MAAKKFSIEAIFKAIDKISNPLRGMNRSTNAFSRGLRTDFAKAQRQVDSFTRNFKKKLGTVVKSTLLGVGLAAVAGLGIAGREYVDFQNTVIAASAKFGPAFQQGTEGFEQLGAVARKIGAETEFSAKAAAEGLDFLALAGFKADQAMALLPGVVDLATAAQTDLASASDIASDSLGAFGLMTEDSAQLASNFNRVMDVMAKTTTTSNTDLATLFESVKKGGAAFTAAGQSLESFSALAGAMANAGLKGSESGTQLRNIMLRLAKPTSEASALLKKLGVITQDEQGNFRDVIDIIGDFEKGLSGMGTAQRSAAIATIFGSRSVTGMNLLLDQGAESLRAYRTQLTESSGAAAEMAAVMRGSLKNQIASLQSAALELGFKFFEVFEGQGALAISELTKAVRAFDITPIIGSINLVVKILQTLFRVIKPIAPIILSVVAAQKLYNAALIAGALITKGLQAGMLAFRAVQFMFVAATQGMTVAQAAFNGVAMANPISLIIVAIGILIGLIILAVKHWDTLSAALSTGYERFKAIALFLGGPFVAPIILTIELIKTLVQNMGLIKEAFSSGQILRGILLIGGAILSSIIEPFRAILELFGKLPGVGKPFAVAATGLESFQNLITGQTGNERRAAEAEQLRNQAFESSQVAPVSAAERASVTREEINQTAELTIRDETGRAEMTRNPRGRNVRFNPIPSGGF